MKRLFLFIGTISPMVTLYDETPTYYSALDIAQKYNNFKTIPISSALSRLRISRNDKEVYTKEHSEFYYYKSDYETSLGKKRYHLIKGCKYSQQMLLYY